MTTFRFSFAALELYGGFWSELADWYLERPSCGSTRRTTTSVFGVCSCGLLERIPQAAAPGDAVRDRGDLVAHAGRGARAARGRGIPGPEEVEVRRGRRARELGRMIEAVTALRRYPDEVGAKPSAAVRGHLVADVLLGPWRDHVARLARFEWVEGLRRRRRRASRSVPIPAAPSRSCHPRRSTRVEAAGTDREAERAGLGPRRSSGRRRKLANESRRPRRPQPWWTRSAGKLADYREALAQLRQGV